jgi:inosine-uridine nucleoside N-ribohydrolase
MKVIFDQDGSSDDIIALLFLLSCSSDISIEGITIPHTGEVHGEIGAKNMADLCYLYGKPNIPIAYALDQPIHSSGKPFPSFLREIMDNILIGKNIPKHPNPNIINSAVTLMKTILENSDDKLTILATGPLTNIAEFIDTHPLLINKIEKIVIMGGAVHAIGNIKALDPKSDNEVAEWNIYADPKSAETVFQSGIPILLVPLDATNQVPMTKEFYDNLANQDHPGLKLTYQLLKAILDQFGMDIFINHFYLWDPLAAMITHDPKIALTEKIPLLVDLNTAQVKCVDLGSYGSALIDVAVKIINPELILGQLTNKIKSHLITEEKVDSPETISLKITDYLSKFGHFSSENQEKDINHKTDIYAINLTEL